MKKVVFITGASRGIGFASVTRFVAEGWQVAGFYKNAPGPQMAGVKWYQVDIRQSQSIKDSFATAMSDFGQIDCLVNSAGVMLYKQLTDYDDESLEEVVSINEKGTYLFTQATLGHMRQGSIINLSSTVAHVGSSDPIYAATKGAILSFTKAMAKALAPNIRVNSVAPGATMTDMMKNHDPKRLEELKEASLLKKIAQPEEIAAGIYFLASEDASHITGICLDINAGYVLR